MKKKLLVSLASLTLIAAPVMFGATAAENYGKFCASCHGKDGAGHTKAGQQVKVKDLTDATVQKSFTDDVAFKDLKEGLTDKDGTVRMKPMAEKMSDDEIKAVVAYVRTFAK